MARRSKRKSNQLIEKIASIASLLILIAAWWFGGVEISERQFSMLDSLVEKNQQLVKVEDNLFQVIEGEETKSWLSIGSGIGYGGELNVALQLNNKGIIQQVSILSIKDTSSYVSKVVENGLLNKILGANGRTQIQADGISGATLSSNGILQGVNNAADPVRQKLFNYQLEEQVSPLDTVGVLDALAVIMFFLAVYVSRTNSIHKVKMQWTLMIVSLGSFGFYSASLISSSTIGILVSGSWTSGLGNYTALILLILTIGYILLFNKNLYCQMLCPMGITQQCLSKLTNSKAISLKHKSFQWFPRFLLLSTLACGLYFRNPAAFSYEPFGIMFGMVGSLYLFILTLLVLLTSLLVHRPWCKTLCPIMAMTDYIVFIKDWYKQASKPKKKKKTTKAVIHKQPATAQSIAVNVEEA